MPGLAVVALMIVWAIDNGGYDAGTWYWGALALLSLAAIAIAVLGIDRIGLSPASRLAVAAFAAYVAWSYLSIAGRSRPATRSRAPTARCST